MLSSLRNAILEQRYSCADVSMSYVYKVLKIQNTRKVVLRGPGNCCLMQLEQAVSLNYAGKRTKIIIIVHDKLLSSVDHFVILGGGVSKLGTNNS
jgi:hypothetical protein